MLGVALLAVLWLGISADRQVGARQEQTVAASAVPARPDAGGASRSARTDATTVFAAVDGLELTLPHARPLAVGYHEASSVEALAFTPFGSLLSNDNPSGYTAPAAAAGPEYRVLSSQGRGRPATSSVDVAVPLGDIAFAPITGTVRTVTEYPLYGRVRDWRVEITPEGRPDLTVVLVHLLRPNVSVGDAVTAGETAVAVPRLLPFDSHIDGVLDERHPHVHIEVTPSSEPDPIDPNQPAQPAGD